MDYPERPVVRVTRVSTRGARILARCLAILTLAALWIGQMPAQAQGPASGQKNDRGIQANLEHPVLPIGSPLPDFALPGVDGKTHKAGEYAGPSRDASESPVRNGRCVWTAGGLRPGNACPRALHTAARAEWRGALSGTGSAGRDDTPPGDIGQSPGRTAAPWPAGVLVHH